MQKLDIKRKYEEDLELSITPQRLSKENEEQNSHSRDETNPEGQKFRSGSAPLTLDPSALFLYMEDDDYTRSFSKGPINNSRQDFQNSSDNEEISKSIEAFKLLGLRNGSKGIVFVNVKDKVESKRKLTEIQSAEDESSSPSPSHSPKNRSVNFLIIRRERCLLTTHILSMRRKQLKQS
jgi:hypothetical protein